MNKYLLLSAAVAGLLTVTSTASADEKYNGKCYGIARAGHNACANANGVHSCKGQAKVDKDPGDFIMTPQIKCIKRGGKTEAPVK